MSVTGNLHIRAVATYIKILLMRVSLGHLEKMIQFTPET
jgi:hypothetical protein